MKIDLMVDLETLGTSPGYVVTRIAIVPFSLDGSADEYLVNTYFDSLVDIGSSIAYRFKINEETVNWWHSQDNETLDTAFNQIVGTIKANEVSNEIELYLIRLRDKIRELLPSDKLKEGIEFVWWGNGPTMDIGLLAEYFTRFKEETPWKYRDIRDVRTLNDMYNRLFSITDKSQDPKHNTEFEGIPHHPVSDCQHQIKYCKIMYKNIKGKVS